jgi:ABC transport system ATP-binding/permease protein
MALLSLRNISLAFGGPRLLDEVSLQIEQGERLCLMGRNGEGKSTLLRLIRGEIGPDEGELIRQQGLVVSLLPQQVPLDRAGTVADQVAHGLQDQGHDSHWSDHRVQAIVSRLSLDPDAIFENLSSGMKRRVLLGAALVTEPDILLLDEPTNHLDIESIRWLEAFLLRSGGTLIFVTHDRVFLEKLATRIVELDRGHLYDWACDYPTFLKRRDELFSAEAKQQELFDKKLAQEEVWIRKGIEARRTRNEGRVRALKAMREERRKRRERQGIARIQSQEAERSGTLVIEAKNLSFGYGEESLVVQNLTTTILRGDKVGIIGANASGKTTLIRLLLGDLTPREGTVRHGTRLEVAYFDQLKATLDENKTVQQNISDYDTIPINGQPRHIISYLEDFLFPPERSRSLVKFLSGGERSRLLLARLFVKPSNVLIMDEPTNDLDIETLELLEALLVEYQGTVLLVSHDRAFLNEVVTSTLAIETDGSIGEYDGGYDDYLRQQPEPTVVESKSSAATRSDQTSAAPEKRKKLSFKEKRERDALPGQIEKMEAEICELHATIGDPSFYKRDRAEIAKTNARLEELEKALAAAYERWEVLERAAG